jgi:hypothetical protein
MRYIDVLLLYCRDVQTEFLNQRLNQVVLAGIEQLVGRYGLDILFYGFILSLYDRKDQRFSKEQFLSHKRYGAPKLPMTILTPHYTGVKAFRAF